MRCNAFTWQLDGDAKLKAIRCTIKSMKVAKRARE
jgi:hypothetical protein